MSEIRLRGVIAEFPGVEELVHAARAAKNRGYSRMEAYTPFPVPELDEIIVHRNWLPLVVLLAGATGTLTAYVLQVYIAVYDYPINVGGRPLHSWPSFVVVMFELTILFASLAAFFGTLFFNGLPQPYHPAGNLPIFDSASQDRFFLCLESANADFDPQQAADFLRSLHPERVEAVVG
jgi:hypothetical protein